ncbi:hypothetical protein KY312_02095 [Candidatus Woesearchaeota archaeon]|nr:hypothetical protein [Candidatus Woesearchaeota archaeon]
MAKRYTDTDKWKDPWYRKLSPKFKCLWDFLYTQCNHAGIWIVDPDQWEFCIGESIDINEAKKILSDRIHEFDNGEKWFIIKFIDFQYGELRESNNVHKSVINILEKAGLWQVYMSTLQGAKDKDKDKDKDKEKDNRGALTEKRKTNRENAKILLEFLNKQKAKITGKEGQFKDFQPILDALNRGSPPQDIQNLILNQVDNPYMRENPQYFCPSTLMRKSHFDKYLNTDYRDGPAEDGKRILTPEEKAAAAAKYEKLKESLSNEQRGGEFKQIGETAKEIAK